ncbi:glycoside hydrolase family 3 C-terminal domain-containing protein [Shewanella insulae]|uniref:beta-glucosidase n=1 Tax=Shewanella insulae TaxID=2681496 RepID=UPI001EFCEFF0|nr:glycoside hydrolase family 3 C-terminal domain-containing protein [Shewanella insulae]MCG9754200.1 glycoside hydrolase family 3 C-terminal domain-containing protein [Shewanella insulae]
MDDDKNHQHFNMLKGRKYMRLNKITSAMMIFTTAFLWGCGDGGSSEIPGNPNSDAAMIIPAGLIMSNAEADQRAEVILAQMTIDQKIQLVHGHGMPNLLNGYTSLRDSGMYHAPEGALPDAVSYIPGIPALGIPDNNIVDSGSGPNVPGQNVTSLPAPIAVAATWDPIIAERAGQRTGLESRTLGFATALGGAGINLTRDPRNGRTFEYAGEDPILAGEMAAARIIGTQSQQVMMSLKHYAMNGVETDRFVTNSVVDEQTMRETELLGFEIAVQKGNPAYIMCAYNRVNDIYSCENEYLLGTLKDGMGFQGMVQTDWGAHHSTVESALAGVDEEQPGIERNDYEIPSNLKAFFGGGWFAQRLADAIATGDVPMSRLDDMVFRKLRSMIITGVMDNPPPARQEIDQVSGNKDAYTIAAASMVLLKNDDTTLPLVDMAGKKIAVIGMYADKGVLSGGGSGGSQPYYDNQAHTCPNDPTSIYANCPVVLGVAPLKAIRDKFPNAQISYHSGDDLATAVSAAANADVAIVFAGTWGNEGADNLSLSLPSPATDTTGTFTYDQDALIAAVAEKSKKSVVILESGSAVKMPWLPQVDAVLDAWYPGEQGAYAIADILSGAVNPSGKLPLTFPKDESDLVMPDLPMNVGKNFSPFGLMILAMEPLLQPVIDAQLGEGAYWNMISVKYDEKLLLNGYKWMDANDLTPQFHFGHGLSYTTFSYSGISASEQMDGSVDVTFNITNTGGLEGAEIAQVYASLPDNTPGSQQPEKKLVGWKKVDLAAGDSKTVTVNVPKKYISTWDVSLPIHGWTFTPGQYDFQVSDSADSKSANTLSTSLTLGY